MVVLPLGTFEVTRCLYAVKEVWIALWVTVQAPQFLVSARQKCMGLIGSGQVLCISQRHVQWVGAGTVGLPIFLGL